MLYTPGKSPIIHPVMKVNTYKVLEECVERGITYGWRRAHKHCDDPEVHTIQGEIHRATMIEITEYFSFDDEATETIQ
jgi:hypothetical protein